MLSVIGICCKQLTKITWISKLRWFGHKSPSQSNSKSKYIFRKTFRRGYPQMSWHSLQKSFVYDLLTIAVISEHFDTIRLSYWKCNLYIYKRNTDWIPHHESTKTIYLMDLKFVSYSFRNVDTKNGLYHSWWGIWWSTSKFIVVLKYREQTYMQRQVYIWYRVCAAYNRNWSASIHTFNYRTLTRGRRLG